MRASHFMVLPAMALDFCLNLGLAVTFVPSVMSSTQWLTSASLFSPVPHYQACQGRTVNWLSSTVLHPSFSLSGNTEIFKVQSWKMLPPGSLPWQPKSKLPIFSYIGKALYSFLIMGLSSPVSLTQIHKYT